MNLILLTQADFIETAIETAIDTASNTNTGRVRLQGRRLEHLQQVLQAKVGDRLAVGLHNGLMGCGEIIQLTPVSAELQVTLEQPPPPPLPLKLVLALPRPKMLKRILQTVATLGVKELYLINAFKVEKSFWQTPWLAADKLSDNLTLGLEQAKDTQMPQVHLRKRFKPFVEDELPGISANTERLVAHPGVARPCPAQLNRPTSLCIGPEGGFIPYEVDRLIEQGFTPVHLGPRILRVDTAVPVLISRLFDGCI